MFLKSSAQILKRNTCLDKAFSFATDYDYYYYNQIPRCNLFSENDTKTLFEGGSTLCNTTCEISLYFKYQKRNILTFVSMVFESYNYSARTGCSSSRDAQLFINCSNLRREQLGIFFNGNCKERNADCTNWNNFCVCHCFTGYFMYYGHCIKANLSLNTSCIFNDQCSGSPYASCLGEKCSCIEGYEAVNSTDCVLSIHGLNEVILKSESHESPRDNIRAILGALLGGLLLGVIITTGTVYILYRRSRYLINTRRRKEPRVMYAANDTFDDGRDEDTFQNDVVTNKSKDKQKKVLNVSPLARPQELPEYSNMSVKESAMTTMDDVYNHLNEKGETQDEDTYDHACAAATRSHLKDLDDYSNMHNMDDGTTMSGGTENDDYFTLEHN
ncbi:uncharacterized protein [Magallana gigas]|uniref:uncharacterized protein isoform X3 n=1 Tax=Magallana gigas TaxID=29159 RepID=UPI003341A239